MVSLVPLESALVSSGTHRSPRPSPFQRFANAWSYLREPSEEPYEPGYCQAADDGRGQLIAVDPGPEFDPPHGTTIATPAGSASRDGRNLSNVSSAGIGAY